MSIDDKTQDHALSIMLTEFQLIRAEMMERLKMQKQVERLILILIGTLIAGAAFIVQHKIFIILPFSTVVFCILTISFFEQDINITVLAGYAHRVLRVEICNNVGGNDEYDTLMSWEAFRKKAFLKSAISKYLTLNRTTLLYIPPILPVGMFLYLKYYTSYIAPEWEKIEIASMLAVVAGLISIVYFAVKVPKLYNDIAKDEVDHFTTHLS